MSKIKVFCDGFSAPYLHVNHAPLLRNVTRLDIVRGVITVGKPNWGSALIGGFPRMLEMGGISLKVYAYISTASKNLFANKLYHSLESSDKGASSYHLGMGVAKVISEIELNVPWLQHLDPLIKSGAVKITTGSAIRGDLVGEDALGNWHVIEAKGRSNTPSITLLSEAKDQARRIVSINGISPSTKSACISDFSKNPISVDFIDPNDPPIENAPMELSANIIKVLREYYANYYALANSDFSFQKIKINDLDGSPTYHFVKLFGSEMSVGIQDDLYDFFKSSDYITKTNIPFLRRLSKSINKTYELNNISIGLDGLAFMNK